MDPISMMALMGGVSSLAGFAGGAMNASSQQAINAQNLQATEYVNQGMNLSAYYNNLRNAANRSGFNPLALIGARGPDVGFSAGVPETGAGLQSVGKTVGAMDPLIGLQMEKAQVDIANARQLGNNAAIEGARNSWMLDHMQKWSSAHPDWAPEGLQPPTLVGSGADWLNNIAKWGTGVGDTFHNFMGRIPESVWNTP